jgi:cyclic 2,3-diphosphoglycerate synthetase
MRALVLVDGEHYPSVTLDAIAQIESRGYQVVAAVFLGGGEKLGGALDLGEIPVVDEAPPARALQHAIASWAPELVLELSDDPVLDHDMRMMLAGICLFHGVPYHGADFRFEVPNRPRVAASPSIAVIGTGKRSGKTAVAAFVSRTLKEEGLTPVVVAMGRGGPAAPRVVRGDEAPPSVTDLIRIARQGEHAASDLYEDALAAGVAVVGARRAGAGMAGAPMADTVRAAVEAANGLAPDMIVLDGSGTAVPPVAADATILVAGGSRGPETLAGLASYRVLLADLVVATMLSEPVVSTRTLSALTSLIRDLARDVAYVGITFRPTPLGSVAGRRVYLATTAPVGVGDELREHLESVHEAKVVGVTHRLSDRAALATDLAGAKGSYEVLVTELKAAAIDVAAAAATEAGADVVFADNRPVSIEGDLRSEVLRLAEVARKRFEAR